MIGPRSGMAALAEAEAILGDGGIYIGSGVLVIILIVLILFLFFR